MIWSFGGWTWSGGFGQASQNPAAFAESCYNLVEDPRWADVFDGIDIDWEYPNACGLSCDTSGPDALSKVLSALRTKFGSSNLVTAAITADASDGGKMDVADYGGAAKYIDWYNVMTYDFFGAWAKQGPTAPHSPLTSYPGIPQVASTAPTPSPSSRRRASRRASSCSASASTGAAGRASPSPSRAAPPPVPHPAPMGRIEDYKVLKSKCPATGTIAGTAYAKCGSEWWSYDTPSTIRGKMAYAKDQGLGGAFFWELTGDTANGELIGAMRGGLG